MRILFVSFFCILTSFSIAQNWVNVDNGFSLVGYNGVEIISFDNKLFAGGYFIAAGNNTATGIACWNGRQWLNFTNSSTAFQSIRSFVIYKNELYGFARYFDDSNRSELVKYDQGLENWISVPNSAFAQTLANGNLYDGVIHKSIEFQGDLYVAGSFDKIGDKDIKSTLVKWDGETWTPVLDSNNGNFYATTITDMEIYQNDLLISGSNFHFNDVSSFNGIVQYDGTTWKSLKIASSGSLQAHIIQLETYKGSLYAAGRGSVPPSDNQWYWLVKWDGQEWEGIEGFEQYDFDNSTRITALKTYGNYLVVGGTNNGVTALYNGDTIKYLEQNLNEIISHYEVHNTQLFASGYFFNDSGKGISKLENLTEIDSLQTNFNLYPNPTNGNFIIEYEIQNKSRAIIEIFDNSGKLVFTETFNDLEGKYVRHISIQDFSSGIYIFKIQTKDFTEAKIFFKT